MNMHLKLSIPCLTLIASISNSPATIVAEYLFVGGSTADTANAPTVIAKNFAETYPSDAGFSSFSDTAYAFITVVDPTIPGAIGSDEYFTFSIDPNGDTMDFSSLDFTQLANSAKAPSSGDDFTVAVFSSATGFTDGDELASFTISNNSVGSFVEERTISLSGVSELQNVTAETEFRFYFASDMDYSPNAQSNGNMRIDNVILSTIPEPSSYALLVGSIAGVAMLYHRRLQR